MGNWRDNLRRVVPYTPGEQPQQKNVVKLNTNENPYPPAPGVKKLLSEMDDKRMRLYPDPAAKKLVNAIADYYNVDENMVFVGVGSDDVIAMCFLTFFNSEKPILFPDISYSFYSVWADLFKVKYECPKLNEKFELVKEDYYKENGGIIFPNPNAPTSSAVSLEFVEDIVKHNSNSIVIIDEAYVDFGAESALELTRKYENLLVVQTYSKSRSMAGMRIGYAIGNAELIKALNDVKYSFNSYTLNYPSIELGVAAIKDESYFKETVAKIIKTREAAKVRLSELGFSYPDSKANFLFVTHKNKYAGDIFDYLKSKNIYVRYFKKEGIDNYLRITVGTDEQMEILYKELENYLNKKES